MKEKDYLTIKEVADKVGVSYQAIYKRLNSTLKPYVEVVEGRKMLRSAVLVEVFEPQDSTVEENIEPKLNENLTPSSSAIDNDELLRINRRNEEIIDKLQAQLLEKDEQIKNQSEHIIELSSKIAELFENNQKLQLNYQYLLNDSKEQPYEEVNTQGARSREEVIEEPKKKGFFNKLFNS